ncbi:hypothetical protein [Cohnella sp. WQ 127256]|uniref:hypothetical protein n=1 Tax=Cohnella sp. WQ 127256 TaxID=2938790 RepID=UPI002117AE99|nr:hypothetical protein [Cohnella sp. WQ 127256]
MPPKKPPKPGKPSNPGKPPKSGGSGGGSTCCSKFIELQQAWSSRPSWATSIIITFDPGVGGLHPFEISSSASFDTATCTLVKIKPLNPADSGITALQCPIINNIISWKYQ